MTLRLIAGTLFWTSFAAILIGGIIMSSLGWDH